MKHWYCHCPGAVYAFDVYAKNKAEARRFARKILAVDRLPKGTALWLA